MYESQERKLESMFNAIRLKLNQGLNDNVLPFASNTGDGSSNKRQKRMIVKEETEVEIINLD